jgi:hypothetical protein
VGVKGIDPNSEIKLIERGLNPTISPDNHWLAYESSDRHVWVVPLTLDRTPIRVSQQGGGREPLFAPADVGRELFYRSLDGTMMSVPYGSAPEFALALPDPLFPDNGYTYREGLPSRYYDVAPDGRFVMLKNALPEGRQPTIRLVQNLFELLKQREQQAR